MKKRKVIKVSNLKRKLPIFPTLVAGIALDFWNAPQWLWGTIGALFFIAWAATLIDIYQHDDVEVDIFDEKEENKNGVLKKTFEEKINERRSS